MKYKATLYFKDKDIAVGFFEVGIMEFPRQCGKSFTKDGFAVSYKALNTKENKAEIAAFLKKFPTFESFNG